MTKVIKRAAITLLFSIGSLGVIGGGIVFALDEGEQCTKTVYGITWNDNCYLEGDKCKEITGPCDEVGEN